MKRGVLFALLALLALLVASTATAVATPEGTAEVSKGKKKKCKKKGKGKHRPSASASAKKKGCKKQGKKPGGSPKEEGSPQPATPGGNWPPADGNYSDKGQGIAIDLSGGGSSAKLTLGSSATCTPATISGEPRPAAVTSTTLTTGGDEKVTAGPATLTIKWTVTMTSDLAYTATIDSKLEGGGFDACDKPGVVIKGTFVKGG